MSDEQVLPGVEDEPQDDLPSDELLDEELDEVVGGADVISPRDPASGLPTGKRL